jgi:hypothetical protein
MFWRRRSIRLYAMLGLIRARQVRVLGTLTVGMTFQMLSSERLRPKGFTSICRSNERRSALAIVKISGRLLSLCVTLLRLRALLILEAWVSFATLHRALGKEVHIAEGHPHAAPS